MTNINCSSNCLYQQDGKCNFESILEKKIIFIERKIPNCAYFVTKKQKDDSILS